MNFVDENVTTFLNVDLDIYSRSGLEPLVDALADKIGLHYVGREGKRFSAHFDLALCSSEADANERIQCLVALVKRLPKSARALWNNAQVRDFNIGIQAGTKPHSTEFPIESETLRAILSVNGRLVITIYAVEVKQLRTRTRH